jgi:uncharacterized membrane protein
MSQLPQTPEEREEMNRILVLVAYALGIVGMFTAFLTVFIALIICYIKRKESVGTVYHSHYQWLISTFWIGCIGLVVSICTFFFGIGVIIYFILCLWLVYRFVKGLLRFSERKAVV